jgi:hypothetical protein
MNRRRFLSNVVTAGAAAGLTSSPAFASPATQVHSRGLAAPESAFADAPLTLPTRPLNRQMFLDATNAPFAVDGAGPLVIEEVVGPPGAGGLDQFTVVFRDRRAGPLLAPGIHTLSHPAHGHVQLYLEPSADAPVGARYRATVCLLVSAPLVEAGA